MVLAELACDITLVLEKRSKRHVFGSNTQISTRSSDFGQTGSNRRLAGNERRSPGGATLLPVVIGKLGALGGNAVNVRR